MKKLSVPFHVILGESIVCTSYITMVAALLKLKLAPKLNRFMLAANLCL